MSTEIRRLIETWRQMAVCRCSIHCECDASGYAACADELEALLASQRPPTEDWQEFLRTVFLEGWAAHQSNEFADAQHALVESHVVQQIAIIEQRQHAVPSPAAPQPEKWRTCRHQYWDLGWCIDCGIHSNDPRYTEQLRERANPSPTLGSLAQEIAAIAWACVKQCKDHSGPPVMCVTHQLEAEAVLRVSPAGHSSPEAQKDETYQEALHRPVGDWKP